MSEWCEATRTAYGDLVKKPPLTDKLLAKPPFKFLLDLISATLANSGYLSGLYSDEEIAEAGSAKETKVAFLDKAVVAVELASGSAVDLKPSKVVAGQEPEKTNLFLQRLVGLAKSGDDGAEIVAKVLAGEKLSASSGSAGSNKENATEKPKEPKEPKEGL